MTGKPTYSHTVLESFDSLQLHTRIDRIDNRMAREVAVLIWNEFTRMWASDNPDLDPNRISWPLSVLRAVDRKFLYVELDELRRVCIGAMLLESPQLIRERWQELHPLLRMVMRPPAGKDSSNAGRDLVEYHELLTGQTSRVPGFIIRAALRWGAIGCMIILPFLAMLLAPAGTKAGYVLLPSLLYVVLYLSVMYRVESRQYLRLLALYISFTDEFVTGEPDGG